MCKAVRSLPEDPSEKSEGSVDGAGSLRWGAFDKFSGAFR